jgi:hypothetical protein
VATAPTTPSDPDRSDFPSQEDLDDADDILFAHPPMRVVRWFCHCGQPYPCDEVRFALLVKGANT